MPTAPDNTTVRIKVDEVKDDMEFQRLRGQGRYGEYFGSTEKPIMRAQNYGFSANPPAGSIGLLTALNGNPDQAIAHYVEHPDKRPRGLQSGEWKLYDAWDHWLHATQELWNSALKAISFNTTDMFRGRVGAVSFDENDPRITITVDWVKLRAGPHWFVVHRTDGVYASEVIGIGDDPDSTK